MDKFVKKTPKHFTKHMSIEDIYKDSTIASSNKHSTLVFNVWNNNIPLENLELFLRNYDEGKGDSKYRRLITLYDYKRYK